MRSLMKWIIATAMIVTSTTALGAGKIQNEDVKSAAELVSAGGTAAQHINDTKIWASSVTPAQSLSSAITSGLIGGGGGNTGKNYLSNNSFEANSGATFTGWTVTNATASANTTSFHDGSQSISLVLSAAGSLVQDVTPTTNLQNTNLEAGFWINAPVGFTGTVCGRSNGVTLTGAFCTTVNSFGGWFYVSANFLGPATGTSIGISLAWTSTSGTVLVDQAYLGQATNFSFVTSETDWTSYSLTIGATTTPPTQGAGAISSAKWRRVGDSMELSFTYIQTAAGSAGSGTYLFPIPSGYTVDTTKVTYAASAAGSGQGGTILGIAKESTAASGTTSTSYVGDVFAVSSNNLIITVGNVTNGTDAPIGSGELPLSSTNASYSFHALVPIQGWTSNTQAVSVANTNYDWTAYTPTFTGFGTVSSPSCWHKRDGPDLLVRCTYTSGTSTATQARVSLPNSLTSADSTKIATLEVCGKYDVNTSSTTFFGSGTILCSQSAAFITFGQESSTTNGLTQANGSVIVSAAGLVSFFARVPIQGWTDNGKAPILIGSVTSNTTNALRMETAILVANTGPTITSQSSNLVSSISRVGTGTYTVSFTAGTFSSNPTCSCTSGAGGGHTCNQQTLTTTGFTLQEASASGSASDGDTEYLICIGPR